MNHAEALQIVEKLSQQSTHYKSMDITSQMTQLNALVKLTDTDPFKGSVQVMLNQCVQRRRNKLYISIVALCVLEEEWTPLVSKLPDLVVSPIDFEAL